ncbi:G-type lectin S-receptor-like serine/threonine-protein kinase At1g11330 isoform X2 [Spinacia oleracea]|uniref:Receptor-like serine/threonine-protein kinase n=2 Tax=Spinacia oleracea TaxID=3562 RepID=A0ABM3R2D4_SPIOL|nr:G-type lectin S-receptor-like serine/threonine-protein kinase At1g11330 isoform X2 [Spinacia oleracea]
MVYVHTLLLFLSWVWVFDQFGLARGDITTARFLRDPETLESREANFKFGFFSPVNSTNRYVGIWYNKEGADQLEVVWVANRDNPLNDSSGVIRISGNGNLQLLDGQNNSIWSTNVTANNEVNSNFAQILDTGNLVLLSNASENTMWQSFDHPTNSFLLRMVLTSDGNASTKPMLTSWKNASNPSNGLFTAGIYHRRLSEFFIWDGDRPYWRSGPWDGRLFMGVRAMYYSAQDVGFRLENENDGTFSLSFSSASQSVTEHYVLTYDGMLTQREWEDDRGDWNVAWQSLQFECDVYGKCGEFGSCNSNNSPICSCLRGFEPRNNQEWSAGNWSDGCIRRTPLLQCGTVGGREDGFLRLRNVKVPDNAARLESDDEGDCQRQCLGNCSCSAYTYNFGFGCMIWSENLIDIQEFASAGVDLFTRVAHSELGETNKWKVTVAVTVILGTAVLVVFLYSLWRWLHRRHAGKITLNKESNWHNNMVGARLSDAEFQDLPLMKFESLVLATDNFSESKKLGQGGFGPVYKGTFEDGQEVAVKRLSRASGQGQQEFMNEVVVISKLQNRNLVRLLGCCVEGEEKLLVYEYMPNKSLDALLFDPSNREHLDWKKRFNIIKAISRGLLYLHRDSRLRIIHRDLKASNILLDNDLNPKISDFGMARIFESNQDQGDTKRIVGTYGYMSPEYAMEGRFSEKSDVYSFGVLLLEIVSGRRNSSFKDEESMSLLGHAWKLWNEGDILSLIDPAVSALDFQAEILRCIQVGLLSVQEFPEDRPSITTVVSMIESEITDLPRPTQPGFTQRRIASWNGTQQNGRDCYSVNGVSISSLGGR